MPGIAAILLAVSTDLPRPHPRQRAASLLHPHHTFLQLMNSDNCANAGGTHEASCKRTWSSSLQLRGPKHMQESTRKLQLAASPLSGLPVTLQDFILLKGQVQRGRFSANQQKQSTEAINRRNVYVAKPAHS